MANPPLLLASISPRRRELLNLTSLAFDIQPANVDETRLDLEPPDQYVLRLAEHKARVAAPAAKPGQLVLASDTTVVLDGEILGKPEDAEDARRILSLLRNRVHQVYTGIAMHNPQTGRMVRDLCITDVQMRDYSDAEMEAYIASGDPMDKAGAYAIQNEDFHPVESYRGCFTSVMGLPVCLVADTLRIFGLEADVEGVSVACQHHFNIVCPVCRAVQYGSEQGNRQET